MISIKKHDKVFISLSEIVNKVVEFKKGNKTPYILIIIRYTYYIWCIGTSLFFKWFSKDQRKLSHNND